MNYTETIAYMYNQLPMFHRVGKVAYKASLDNAQALDEMCGYPHKQYKTIHVAGTNGKGSVSHMLASVLQCAGYKTGLFTSPHLVDFRERIKVNGQMISEEEVIHFIESYMGTISGIQPSFFEMTSAMAFEYFKRQAVDVAVIETGLGGRLDSTNIITPILSIITNIAFDHTDLLGETLGKIAGEKAGIIKNGVPVVVGETHSETETVFKTVATAKNAVITFADQVYKAEPVLKKNIGYQTLKVDDTTNRKIATYSLDLLGNYQQKNICTVLAAIDSLKTHAYDLTDISINNGLKKTSSYTGLLGRWQVLGHKPLIICDTGHNEAGIRCVVKQIEQLEYQKLHFVFGVVSDKDISRILPLLPKDAEYYFTRASIPRAMDEHQLMEQGKEHGLIGKTYKNVSNAIDSARRNSKPNDLIFIGGSTFIVAEALV
jgi:dihydrofolate synthase / folylpolyglutamate synthase